MHAVLRAVLSLEDAGGVRDGWAWGATGHEWISGIAVEKLPEEIPAFVRTPRRQPTSP